MSYKGIWSMAGGTYPTWMSTWDFYLISAAWTGGSIYYNIGDMMVGNKYVAWVTTSADWDKIKNVDDPESDPIAMWTINSNSGNRNYFLNNSGNRVNISMTGNWNTAYGRGNHASQWYLTWLALDPYLLVANSGTYFNMYSWNYYTSNPLWYITGGVLSWYIPIQWAVSKNIIVTTPEYNTFSVGYANTATTWSTVIGSYNTANAYESVAIWNWNTATWSSSVAIWYGAHAIWDGSFSAWAQCYSIWSNSTTFWFWTTARWEYSTSLWVFNIWLSDSIFEIGIWGNNTNMSGNAMTVTNVGKVGILKIHPQYSLDVSWSIQSDTSFNLTGWFAPFRMAYSGSSVVAQFYTGGNRVTSTVFTLP
jgi:hypothetical protein